MSEVKRLEDVSGGISVAAWDHRVLHEGSWGLVEGPLGPSGGSGIILTRLGRHLELPRSSQDDAKGSHDPPKSTKKEAKRHPKRYQEHLES